MFVSEYIRYDVHDLASLIKSGQVNAEEALNCALLRSEEVNPSLNAVVSVFADFARSTLATMRGSEPYYGVPLLVKDLGFYLKGIKTTEGSRLFANNIPLQNSDILNRLIELGFVPFAKTNTPELGLSYVTESVLFGPCRNPFDQSRTAGGSSGGSAAAVAAGIAPIATASDGGGSIRIPAACCGLFGFKPTTGVMPTGPWVAEQWSGMATSFILTRSIRDTTKLFDQMASHDLGKLQYTKKKKLKISLLDEAFPLVPVASPCLAALKKMEAILIEAGHSLDKRKLPLDLAAIGACTLTLIAANTCSAIKMQEKALGRKAKKEELEPITWEFYQRGALISAHEYIETKDMLYQLVRPLHELLRETDLILTPALAQLPLSIGALSTDDEFTRYLQKNTEFSPFTSLFNQAGLPAMTIPVMMHDQLPISIQLGAGKGKDLLLLDLANSLQTMLVPNQG